MIAAMCAGKERIEEIKVRTSWAKGFSGDQYVGGSGLVRGSDSLGRSSLGQSAALARLAMMMTASGRSIETEAEDRWRSAPRCGIVGVRAGTAGAAR